MAGSLPKPPRPPGERGPRLPLVCVYFVPADGLLSETAGTKVAQGQDVAWARSPGLPTPDGRGVGGKASGRGIEWDPDGTRRVD